MRYLISFLIGFGFGWLACGVREASHIHRKAEEFIAYLHKAGYGRGGRSIDYEPPLYDQDEEPDA